MKNLRKSKICIPAEKRGLGEKNGRSRLSAGMQKMFFLFVLVSITLPANAATLKRNAILNAHTITVGDVFEGTGDLASRVIGASPQPGQDMTLNARTLMKIAMALDINWRPQTTADSATLKRVATVIPHDDVVTGMTNALKDKGLEGNVSVTLDQGASQISLPENTQASIDFSNVDYNPTTGRFSATAYAPSKDNPIYTETLSGRVERMTDIPVLNTTLRNGDVIGQTDISMITVKADSIHDNMIIRRSDLIGFTPRRSVQEGKPIKMVDLIKPEAVERGSLVTMIFKSGTLQLTAEGKALQNGAEGDTIRVINTASNKTVQGLITNLNEVTVKTF